jgi:hypothetical protein
VGEGEREWKRMGRGEQKEYRGWLEADKEWWMDAGARIFRVGESDTHTHTNMRQGERYKLSWNG